MTNAERQLIDTLLNKQQTEMSKLLDGLTESSAPKPIGHWPLMENANDASGNSFHADEWKNVRFGFPIDGAYFHANGSPSWIRIPLRDDPRFNSANWTVALKVAMDNNQVSAQIPFYMGTWSPIKPRIAFTTSTRVFPVEFNLWGQVNVGPPPPQFPVNPVDNMNFAMQVPASLGDGNEHAIGMSFNTVNKSLIPAMAAIAGANVVNNYIGTLYLDGVAVASAKAPAATSPLLPGSVIVIGSEPPGTDGPYDPWRGYARDLKFFDACLTAEQVAAL
jgi:hypothetical protein